VGSSLFFLVFIFGAFLKVHTPKPQEEDENENELDQLDHPLGKENVAALFFACLQPAFIDLHTRSQTPVTLSIRPISDRIPRYP
jgi:hypothetical protein